MTLVLFRAVLKPSYASSARLCLRSREFEVIGARRGRRCLWVFDCSGCAAEATASTQVSMRTSEFELGCKSITTIVNEQWKVEGLVSVESLLVPCRFIWQGTYTAIWLGGQHHYLTLFMLLRKHSAHRQTTQQKRGQTIRQTITLSSSK